MKLETLRYSRKQVNKAGDTLINPYASTSELKEAFDILNNWRACHVYPINTFQSLLRKRTKLISSNPIVAQRLKRTPSILFKLIHQKNMKLSTMQDIGGLRVIFDVVDEVSSLRDLYLLGKIQHVLIKEYDYIKNPKISGYRSIHLVYRYQNNKVTNFNGLKLEIQIRSKIQHAWAMAVETIGTFIGQPLKSSFGKPEWLNYFKVVSAAFSKIENTSIVPGFEKYSDIEIFDQMLKETAELGIKDKLLGFAVALNNVKRGDGSRYHLIVLNTQKKTVAVRGYANTKLEEANKKYAEIEALIAKGYPLQTVLVSTNKVENLQKAYPSYFGDTKEFVRQINIIKKISDNYHEKIDKKSYII